MSEMSKPIGDQQLVADLRKLLRTVAKDLVQRSNDPTLDWARELRAEYDTAFERGRTGLTWSAWRDDSVEQAAVAWVLSSVFVRFCEDNELIEGPWIAGEGERGRRALDAEAHFYQQHPSLGARDWLREGFRAVAHLPASSGVIDPAHSPVWSAPLGADACKAILSFWRETNSDGSLWRSLVTQTWDTRFLGDIYQDLSDAAKKKYALLQTPVFVEEFILDQTLEPALAEFGLEGLRLIDPACGSGHFLLGAFDLLLARWDAAAPGLDRGERVQRAMAHLHGVDVNPFAVAIARFRLTVAGLRASGLRRLKDAPRFKYQVAAGDSLLTAAGKQLALVTEDGVESLDLSDEAPVAYATEDVWEYPGILTQGRYHVVVGNPPYITVKDQALNNAYRQAYPTCYRQYALSVPFMELLFRLAIRGGAGEPAGFVGQITSNSFMKREFGKKVIEQLLAGHDPANPVDLTEVIDSEGAWIPGHNSDGTPTVILFGRRRRALSKTVGCVMTMGKRETRDVGEDGNGPYWRAILGHLDNPGFKDDFIEVVRVDRRVLASHPWSLSGGGAGELKSTIDRASDVRLCEATKEIGFGGVTREDAVYVIGSGACRRFRIDADHRLPFVEGEFLRDFRISASVLTAVWPYDRETLVADLTPEVERVLWPNKRRLSDRVAYGSTQLLRGLNWYEYSMFFADRYRMQLSIAFAEVATHNHFALDRGGKVFNRTAPVIKLPEAASENDHLALLGVLGSSVACFWLRNRTKPKGGKADQLWARTHQFNVTSVAQFPLPDTLPLECGRRLDQLAQRLSSHTPAAVCGSGVPTRERLAAARAEYERVRAEMIAVQEDLDWHVYRLYGLIDEDLTYPGLALSDETDGAGLAGVALGERAFEIVLARRVADGREDTAWFERHRSTPITETPDSWPADYRDLVQRRIELIESDRSIRLLERPEFKRRWQSRTWADMESDALTNYCLDRLEDPELWRDAQGPRVLSVSNLAQLVRADESLTTALGLLAGARDMDLTAELGRLLTEEGVPFLAAYRYTDSGMEKRAEWEQVWELQRREDAGEQLDIPVPPKYGQKDFRKPWYWRARGKLDVPKERFISYPDAGRGVDTSQVLGWAGWDHAEQSQALVRLLMDRIHQDAWEREQMLPLLAGLAELEPWLQQWHSEPDPATGMVPAAALTGLLNQQLAAYRTTRPELADWRPAPAHTRRRRKQ